MPSEYLIKEVHRRRKVFKDLKKHLENIKETLMSLDKDAEIYLFGSVAENTHNLSSDIDVLVITSLEPARVHLVLWEEGIREPFEIHVQPPEKLKHYTERAILRKVD
ncbi:nucleotidyltransferase domain-containing protein [Candidatus Bathyarchaeota archaeon]|nr:nucleotidyltransferase domain-containing protein [Candidatus Bathyarchaeota archaeon]